MSRPGYRRLALAAAPVAAIALTGCGTSTLPKSGIESQIKTQIGKLGTAAVQSASCPNDLDAKVGKVEDCTLTYQNGHKLEIQVTVTAVSNGKGDFSMKVIKVLS
jgi:hypothetical protein